MKRERKRLIRYDEGQWFAVTLQGGGYALGNIVRGGYRTNGGLGYFFAPVYSQIPVDVDTERLGPSDAIYVGWFGDLHIIEGKWPLIGEVSPSFERGKWPIPTFARVDPLYPEERGVLVEYDQEDPGDQSTWRETVRPGSDLIGLPGDGTDGAEAIEIILTKILGQL